MKTQKSLAETIKSYIPEIIELLVTGLIVALADIFFQTDANTNLILSIIGLSTTLLTFTIRLQARDQTEEISDQLELYRLLNAIAWPDLREQGVAAVEECRDKLAQLADGVDLSMSGWMTQQDDNSYARNRVQRAKRIIRVNSSWLLSISSDPEKRFESLVPQHLKQSYVEVCQRGVILERVDFGNWSDLRTLSPDQLKGYVEYVSFWVEAGAKIYICWTDRMDPLKLVHPGFIICDDLDIQIHRSTSRRTGKHKYRSVTVTRNQRTVKEYIDRFEEWKRFAIPFHEVPEFQPYLPGADTEEKRSKTSKNEGDHP